LLKCNQIFFTGNDRFTYHYAFTIGKQLTLASGDIETRQ